MTDRDRIAELEAERDHWRTLYKRTYDEMALVEGERDRLTALTEAQTIALRSVAEDETAARIAELEAERISLLAAQIIDRNTIDARDARIAELEAEVARLSALHDRREAYEGADHVIALEDEVTRLLAALEAKS